MKEMLDIYDSKMHHIGTAPRDEVHRRGLWHQTFHCWIVQEVDEERYVLFQIRDKSKDTAPNKLDITAAGHLKAGESKEDGLRELQEELGITASVDELVYLGIRITASESGDIINKEFAQVYLLRNDSPIESFSFSDGEVAGLVQIKISDGLMLCSHEASSVKCRVIREVSGKKIVRWENISFSQFIPRIDSYYYKVFIMAERYLSGNHYLSI